MQHCCAVLSGRRSSHRRDSLASMASAASTSRGSFNYSPRGSFNSPRNSVTFAEPVATGSTAAQLVRAA